MSETTGDSYEHALIEKSVELGVLLAANGVKQELADSISELDHATAYFLTWRILQDHGKDPQELMANYPLPSLGIPVTYER